MLRLVGATAEGLTSGVLAFADELRRAGHTVHTPDLYDGHTFDVLDDGVGYAREVGFGEVADRGYGRQKGCRMRWCTPGFRWV